VLQTACVLKTSFLNEADQKVRAELRGVPGVFGLSRAAAPFALPKALDKNGHLGPLGDRHPHRPTAFGKRSARSSARKLRAVELALGPTLNDAENHYRFDQSGLIGSPFEVRGGLSRFVAAPRNRKPALRVVPIRGEKKLIEIGSADCGQRPYTSHEQAKQSASQMRTRRLSVASCMC
jgi:hypothetical protein